MQNQPRRHVRRARPSLLVGALAVTALACLACMGAVVEPVEPEPEPVEAVDTGGAVAAAPAEPPEPTPAEVEAPPDEAAPGARQRRRRSPRQPGAGTRAKAPAAPPAQGQPAPAPAPAGAPPPAQAGAADTDEPAADPANSSGAEKPPGPKPPGIRKVGNRSWTVTKTLFDKWKADPYALGRIKEKGAGWEVRQVRQRHGYHLGIRGRDVVMTVNGHKLDTNAQLMAAYVVLKFKKKFDVVLMRNGKKRVHHYEVVN